MSEEEKQTLVQVCMDENGDYTEEPIDTEEQQEEQEPEETEEEKQNFHISLDAPRIKKMQLENERTRLQNKLAVLQCLQKQIKMEIKEKDEEILNCMREMKMPLLMEMEEWNKH